MYENDFTLLGSIDAKLLVYCRIERFYSAVLYSIVFNDAGYMHVRKVM